jgi:hypothetical protein
MTTETKMMNDGARRVQEALAKQGIHVKHGVMLEALATGFGIRNWRTVRDKLSASNLERAPVVKSVDIIGGRWQVSGTYMDNDQPYSGYYDTASAEDAMVHAQVERIFADSSFEILVNYVQDRTGTSEASCFGEEDCISWHAGVLTELMRAARTVLGPPPSRGVVEADAWDVQNAHIEMWESALQSREVQSTLNHLDAYFRHNPEFRVGATYTFINSAGQEFYEMCASDALGTIISLSQRLGPTPPNKRLVYHADALLKYASNELDFVLYCQANK